jgi:hypothetical protein
MTIDLKDKLFQAIGAASMCWLETPKGEFDSSRAKEIGDDLWREFCKLRCADLEEITRLKARYKELVEAAEKAIPEMICTCSGELLCGRCNLYETLSKLKGDV